MIINFDCGCSFPVDKNKDLLEIDFDINKINFSCPKTWDLIGSGNTKGCFQLESRLGQSMSKKLMPENIEQLSALISILRPGCISGNTKILVGYYKHTDGNLRNKNITIEELYNTHKYDHIISYDESTGRLIKNQITNLIDSGTKECFKIKIKTNERKTNRLSYNWYDLECTLDHKLLTPNGWVELKDLKPGTRILVIRKKNGTKKLKKKIKSRFSPKIKIDNVDGIKSYKSRCYESYEYRCVFCDWNKGSLDVNHLEGNRHTNNSRENLCYLCPNHHREYSEGNILVSDIIEQREKYKLFHSVDCKWATYVDKISVGEKRVYDISMKAPHHNFIAGNVVVHNCLEAIREGKSVSNHYIDRKNGNESIDYFHEALEPILRNTYGEMVYQEQAMEIAKDIAGFNLQEADMLRKAIGKKKPEEMAKIKTKFLDGSKAIGKVTSEEAEQIFGWIEKSQRYSFNKSHAVSYAINGYISAYAKAHFPKIFFLSYLRLAKDKIDPQQEISELISNARDMDIGVFGPNLTLKNKEFEIFDNKIYFGLTNIKGLGESVHSKLVNIIDGMDLTKMSWLEILVKVLVNINSSAAKSLILAGGMDYLKLSRNKMLFDLNMISELTNRETEKCLEIIGSSKIKDITELLRVLLNQAKITKNRQPKILSIINQTIKPPYSLEDDPEWISNNERDLLGASITVTKADLYDSSYANTDCKNLKTFPNNKQFFVVAEIDQMSVVVTKKGKTPGKEMCFLRLSDSFGSMDSVVLFPEEFEEYKELLENGRVLMFSGQKSGKNNTAVVKKCFVV